MAQILVVDDVQEYLDLVAPILKKAGYEVITALNGKEALKQYEINNPDLILTDMVMPKMDGREFILSIRSQKKGKKIPIITLTGYPKIYHDLNGAELDVSLKFTKPVSQEDLLEGIALVMQ